ncbi:MAG: response regulator [bacterium]
MDKVPEKVYCISCGEEVPVERVSIGIEGEDLLQCVHCHSYLGTVKQPQTLPDPSRLPSRPSTSPGDFRPEESSGSEFVMPDLPSAMSTPQKAGGELLEEPEPVSEGPPLQTVITVEDSSLISAILNDTLIEQGLTERVIPCKNGYEFLGRYIRERDIKTMIGLVVMDVKMPVLNGISSAVAMRAHEQAQDMDNVPILFFTSKRCDETFRKVLLHCAPAMYINKGSSVSPNQLQDRVGKVVNQLMREEW